MPNFTPEQIEQFLQEFFDVVGKRQYVGARYVPLLGRKGESSIEWDNTAPYEPLTIVLYQGNSYTSRTYVPIGVGIDNTYYWAPTGNYNAQVEAYRRDVADLQNKLPSNAFDANNTVKAYIDDITENVQKYILEIGDSFGDIPDQGSANTWSNELARRLNLTMLNYCEGSAGFVRQGRSGHNFLENLTLAINNSDFDNNDVRLIVVYGGYNDATTNQSIVTFESNVQSLINSVKANFPKSDLIIFGCNTGYRNLFVSYSSGAYAKNSLLQFTEVLEKVCTANGVQFCNTCSWMWGRRDHFKDDNTHPNTLGRNTIVSNMLAFIYGQRIAPIRIDWYNEQQLVNADVLATSALGVTKVIQRNGLNPNRTEFAFEFQPKVSLGTNSHDGGSLWTLNYARLFDPYARTNVYKLLNNNIDRLQYAGHIYISQNSIAFYKESLDVITTDDRFVTDFLPCTCNYTEYYPSA